mmetsp:Transcript_30397/g.90670  ORF Transcript_30397/g.90670 Transcript_30397/m.90670 type:complete len:340 (-) Transcript_30397:1651-2670(-)
MPQCVLDNIKWRGNKQGTWIWLQRGWTGGGGVFTLSPPSAAAVMSATPEEQEDMKDMIFPPGFVSLASERYTYLLSAPNGNCVLAASLDGDGYGARYDGGILGKAPLRVLNINSRGNSATSSTSLLVEVWHGVRVADQDTAPPLVTRTVNFHSIWGIDGKQGFSLPVIPRPDVSYRLSITTRDGNISSDWIIEFSDPVMGHRWGEEFVHLSVKWRDCGNGGGVSSQHERRYVGGIDKGAEAGGITERAWGREGRRRWTMWTATKSAWGRPVPSPRPPARTCAPPPGAATNLTPSATAAQVPASASPVLQDPTARSTFAPPPDAESTGRARLYTSVRRRR